MTTICMILYGEKLAWEASSKENEEEAEEEDEKDVVGMRKLVARIEARVRVLQKGICICSQILIEALERLYSFLL